MKICSDLLTLIQDICTITNFKLDRLLDGKILAGGGNSLQLWDTKTGREGSNLFTGQQVFALAFSPDGKILPSTGKNSILLWDMDKITSATK